MARMDLRLAENAPGDFFVDSSCIDCDTCRQIEPDVFVRSEASEQSFVLRQPASGPERLRSAMALVACPTSSIGTLDKRDVSRAAGLFPEPIEGEVFYCGYTAESSFGASSYLIRRPGANVLVDSPRAAKPLLRRLVDLGGVQRMLLTHRDDVADHAVFRRELGCERWIHQADASAAQTERTVQGTEPFRIDDDFLAIPVPGHTRGSTAFLYRDRFLFTGDHLWWSEREGLRASRSVCWYSWREQVRSVHRLLDFRFEWVLPGHGRRFHASSAAEMRRELDRLLRRIGAP